MFTAPDVTISTNGLTVSSAIVGTTADVSWFNFDGHGLTPTKTIWTPAKIERDMKLYIEFYFNKNHVIWHNKPNYECPKHVIDLPSNINAEQNKFGAACKAIVAIYLRDYHNCDNFVTPVWNYTDPNTHQTTVRFSDGDEVSCKPVEFDLLQAVSNGDYFGQDICYAKKILGSTSAIRRVLDCCDVSECKKREKEAEKKALAKSKEEARKGNKIRYECAVEAKMREIELEREAIKRLNKRMMERDFVKPETPIPDDNPIGPNDLV